MMRFPKSSPGDVAPEPQKRLRRTKLLVIGGLVPLGLAFALDQAGWYARTVLWMQRLRAHTGFPNDLRMGEEPPTHLLWMEAMPSERLVALASGLEMLKLLSGTVTFAVLCWFCSDLTRTHRITNR